MQRYELEVAYDDDSASMPASQAYYRFLNKYNARGIGHERTRTSTVVFYLPNLISRKILARDLQDIRIISIKKSAVSS